MDFAGDIFYNEGYGTHSDPKFGGRRELVTPDPGK
jgi:hypothetical protein